MRQDIRVNVPMHISSFYGFRSLVRTHFGKSVPALSDCHCMRWELPLPLIHTIAQGRSTLSTSAVQDWYHPHIIGCSFHVQSLWQEERASCVPHPLYASCQSCMQARKTLTQWGQLSSMVAKPRELAGWALLRLPMFCTSPYLVNLLSRLWKSTPCKVPAWHFHHLFMFRCQNRIFFFWRTWFIFLGHIPIHLKKEKFYHCTGCVITYPGFALRKRWPQWGLHHRKWDQNQAMDYKFGW